jgi:23S rRNA (pseudouridine1915-N3)-methyltransferase
MDIEIWSIGKEHETFISPAIEFYLKRLQPFCKVSFIVISPPKRSGQTTPQQSLLLEEKIILNRLQSQHFLVVLDDKGKSYTSRAFAAELQNIMNTGAKTLVLLIGGPWGISGLVKQKAKKTISLSSFTFPHQLVRLIISEQLYRAFSILNNTPYHHE